MYANIIYSTQLLRNAKFYTLAQQLRNTIEDVMALMHNYLLSDANIIYI